MKEFAGLIATYSHSHYNRIALEQQHTAMRPTPRRRFLKIIAAASATALAGVVRAQPARDARTWQGEALGADAFISVAGLQPARAERLLNACRAEITRLERIFSLHLPASDISRLNARGVLANPAAELTELLGTCRWIFELSGSAFDPTVQPLWRLYAETYGHPLTPRSPDADAVAARHRLVGFDAVSWTDRRVEFDKPGMAITLNGIAQGTVTDRVTAVLRRGGAMHALVNVGEHSGIGWHPEGRAWQVGIQDPRNANSLIEVMELTEQAVATSGAYGGRFGDSGFSHIIDPRTGRSPERYLSVSVRHASATLADGFSTAFCFMAESDIAAAVACIGGLSVLLVRADGSLARI
jgi:thiamine biosynthesis lipoprotein